MIGRNFLSYKKAAPARADAQARNSSSSLILLIRQMQHLDQKDPGKTIIGNNRYQIVHGGDKRTGRYRRVYAEFLKQDRDHGTGNTGDHHGQKQGHADAGRD